MFGIRYLPPMKLGTGDEVIKKSVKRQKRGRSELGLYLTPRYIFGLILILSSFTSAYLISKSADRTITVWASTVELGPGEEITEGDIAPVRVRLPENAEQYLDARTRIVGTFVLRNIGAAELIPSFAISSTADLSLNRVPISVAPEWFPSDLKTGALIDLYGVPNRNSQLSGDGKTRSKLLLSSVIIDSIDYSAKDLGGRIGMTLLVPSTLVYVLVSSITEYEFLLVRRPQISES